MTSIPHPTAIFYVIHDHIWCFNCSKLNSHIAFIVLPQHVCYIVEHFSYLHYIIVIVQSNILYLLIATRIISAKSLEYTWLPWQHVKPRAQMEWKDSSVNLGGLIKTTYRSYDFFRGTIVYVCYRVFLRVVGLWCLHLFRWALVRILWNELYNVKFLYWM